MNARVLFLVGLVGASILFASGCASPGSGGSAGPTWTPGTQEFEDHQRFSNLIGRAWALRDLAVAAQEDLEAGRWAPSAEQRERLRAALQAPLDHLAACERVLASIQWNQDASPIPADRERDLKDRATRLRAFVRDGEFDRLRAREAEIRRNLLSAFRAGGT